MLYLSCFISTDRIYCKRLSFYVTVVFLALWKTTEKACTTAECNYKTQNHKTQILTIYTVYITETEATCSRRFKFLSKATDLILLDGHRYCTMFTDKSNLHFLHLVRHVSIMSLHQCLLPFHLLPIQDYLSLTTGLSLSHPPFFCFYVQT